MSDIELPPLSSTYFRLLITQCARSVLERSTPRSVPKISGGRSSRQTGDEGINPQASVCGWRENQTYAAYIRGEGTKKRAAYGKRDGHARHAPEARGGSDEGVGAAVGEGARRVVQLMQQVPAQASCNR